jgi:hypothetical protein
VQRLLRNLHFPILHGRDGSNSLPSLSDAEPHLGEEPGIIRTVFFLCQVSVLETIGGFAAVEDRLA